MARDYGRLIAALRRPAKITFYLVLARNLTLATRAIGEDPSLSDLERVEQMTWVNEVQHAVLNRLAAVQGDYATRTEQEVWDLIRQHLAQNQAAARYVSAALAHAYERVARRGA